MFTKTEMDLFTNKIELLLYFEKSPNIKFDI